MIYLELSISRRLYLLISVVVLVTLTALLFFKFEDDTDAVFICEKNSDGETAVITGYTGNTKKLEIPSEIKGYKITAVSEYAFANKDKIEYVTVGNGIESIGDYAFYNCSSLKKVELGDGLKVIGYHAFERCEFLKTIELPETLEEIDDAAFYSCIRLVDVRIPAACTFIGVESFAACESLTLDCSENKAAAEYAELNFISTDFKQTDDYVFLKIAIGTALIGAAVVALYILLPKLIKKKNKNTDRNLPTDI